MCRFELRQALTKGHPEECSCGTFVATESTEIVQIPFEIGVLVLGSILAPSRLTGNGRGNAVADARKEKCGHFMRSPG